MRFYFNIRDHLAIQDEVGRKFSLASEAVIYAKHLAADLRCLETDVRPRLAIQVIGRDTRKIHQEAVFAPLGVTRYTCSRKSGFTSRLALEIFAGPAQL
jgi:hypothetical protein